eukprot:1158642-Pelagomonas_calceolata.AAC.5
MHGMFIRKWPASHSQLTRAWCHPQLTITSWPGPEVQPRVAAKGAPQAGAAKSAAKGAPQAGAAKGADKGAAKSAAKGAAKSTAKGAPQAGAPRVAAEGAPQTGCRHRREKTRRAGLMHRKRTRYMCRAQSNRARGAHLKLGQGRECMSKAVRRGGSSYLHSEAGCHSVRTWAAPGSSASWKTPSPPSFGPSEGAWRGTDNRQCFHRNWNIQNMRFSRYPVLDPLRV